MNTIEAGQKDYLSCAETAKLVRGELKRSFPGVKFSVRSKTYSGGASIDVSWTDGPTDDEVKAKIGIYAGADFDGMIDLKTHGSAWLEPDGSAKMAHFRGTESSGGYLPEAIGDPPSANSREVSFGADYVFTQRSYSEAFLAKIAKRYETLYRVAYDPEARNPNGDSRYYTAREVVRGMAYETSSAEELGKGARVSYEDMANPYREGTIVEVRRFDPTGGYQYRIFWDGDETRPGDADWSDCRQAGWKVIS